MQYRLLRIFILVILIHLLTGGSVWAKREITMALIPLQSPSAMYKRFLPLKRYLERRLDIEIRIKVSRKSSEVIDLLKDGSADIAYLCPTLYTEAFGKVSIKPIVKLKVDGKSYYRSAILVRKDSSYNHMADLIDGSFVYGRYACPGSGLLPEIMLKRVGITDENLLDVARLGSDESALTAVLARMFDATGVPEMVAKPYIDKGLRVLRYSYAIPQYLFVARTSLGPELIGRIKEALLSVNNMKNPETVMGGIGQGVDGFDDAQDRDYDIVRVLLKNLSGGRQDFLPNRANIIRLYVEPVYFEPELFVLLNPVSAYISNHSGLNIEVIVPENMNDFLNAQVNERGALFLENPSLSRIYSVKKGLRPVSALHIEGFTDAMEGLIIVRSDGKIDSLKDLEGKKVGITSTYSEGGYLAQKGLLESRGVSLKGIRLIELGTYENVIIRLYRGEIDAGFVSLAALNSMKKDIDMKAIRAIAGVPIEKDWVVMAQGDLKEEIIRKLRGLLRQYSDFSKGSHQE